MDASKTDVSLLPSLPDGPVVSVLIPARNEQNNITRTLNSLCAQAECPRIEIIVGVNNSTDRTFAVVEEYVRRFDYHEYRHVESIRVRNTSKGKPNTWNELLFEHARCNLCMFIDADVLVDAAATQKLVAALSGDGDLVVAAGVKRDLEDDSRRWYAAHAASPDFITGSLYMCNKAALENYMRRTGFGRMPSTLIHEDGWLTKLLSPDGFRIVPEAVCFHDPCTRIWDIYQRERRCYAAQAQLDVEYPELSARRAQATEVDGTAPALGRKLVRQLAVGKTVARLGSLWRHPRPIRTAAGYCYRYVMFHVVGSVALWHGYNDYRRSRARGGLVGYWREYNK